jgi:hypothetical protein
MLDLKILQQKGDFTKTNGDTVNDLTRRSVSFRGVLIDQGRTYSVEEGIQMRMDLISKIFYQTVSFACVLFKYNGISNPFALDINDLIKVPDGSVLSGMLTKPVDFNGSNENWMNSTRKKKKSAFLKPKTKQDKNRLDYLQANSSTMVAPPNIAKDKSVKVVNGKIIFGTDVTSVKKEDCPDPISRTKLQAALVKNKIFS